MSDLRAELTGIYQKYGELTPQAVVDEARPKTAPLHNRFEWDDATAGEAYRRVQASELIRSVRIQYAVDPKTSERKYVRAFHAVRDSEPDRSGYVPTEELVQDELATKILLKQCEREIADLKRKYGHLKEFSLLINAALKEAS